VRGLEPAAAVEVMSRAMGSQADVAAAAHAPGQTVIRLEGFGPSVEARIALIRAMGGRLLAEDRAERFWAGMHNPMSKAEILWRISAPASRAPRMLQALDGEWRMDWAGGLIWSAPTDATAEGVRRVAEVAGGHAMLMRAPEALRAAVPTLHPAGPGVAALEARVRRAFDPAGVFETGRF
jgi:glycolate oxidase FAD binding subunit